MNEISFPTTYKKKKENRYLGEKNRRGYSYNAAGI